jgi:hypothetical protein
MPEIIAVSTRSKFTRDWDGDKGHDASKAYATADYARSCIGKLILAFMQYRRITLTTVVHGTINSHTPLQRCNDQRARSPSQSYGVPIHAHSHTSDEQKRHKSLDRLATFLYKLWTCPVPASDPSKVH